MPVRALAISVSAISLEGFIAFASFRAIPSDRTQHSWYIVQISHDLFFRTRSDFHQGRGYYDPISQRTIRLLGNIDDFNPVVIREVRETHRLQVCLGLN